jgi:hypothetical protein
MRYTQNMPEKGRPPSYYSSGQGEATQAGVPQQQYYYGGLAQSESKPSNNTQANNNMMKKRGQQ